MKAVILQPMYIPWAGYFGLIEASDVFVFYDDVQFVRRSWQRRNRIKVPDGDFTWLTVPIEKDFGQNINEVKLKHDGWSHSHWQSIEYSYSSTPYFSEYSDILHEVYQDQWDRLVDVNTELIGRLCDIFGITSEFKYSSEISPTGSKTNRLLSILDAVGADEYISGRNARDYIEEDKFEEAEIQLFWHDFTHPEYNQIHGEFVSHLSAIDILFHQGQNAGEIIRKAETGALFPA
jgi:hypothetical protein